LSLPRPSRRFQLSADSAPCPPPPPFVLSICFIAQIRPPFFFGLPFLTSPLPVPISRALFYSTPSIFYYKCPDRSEAFFPPLSLFKSRPPVSPATISASYRSGDLSLPVFSPPCPFFCTILVGPGAKSVPSPLPSLFSGYFCRLSIF